MRGVTRAWPRVCLVGRIGFLAKRSLRSFKSRQSWGWALAVVVMSNMISGLGMVIARVGQLTENSDSRRLAYE